MSVDGYVAGTRQRLDEPSGDGPEEPAAPVEVRPAGGEDLEPASGRQNELVTHLTYRTPR
jgi:hypothetical protein